MIRWPIELIDDIAKRNSVLYLGSGISAASKNDSGKSPATWRKFLEDILDARQEKLKTCHDTIKQLLDKGNYLTACEIIVRHLGERDFGELAADEFRRPGYRPNELHKIIFSLDSRLVITPNIDKTYDQYATTQSNGTVIIKTYRDDIARYLRAPDYLIIKAHGTIDDTDHIVFTHGQYSRVRNDHAAFYRMLDALLLTHTFIFLGCGISDPDIQLVLENLNFSFPGCRPHYMVIPANNLSEDELNCIANNRNLEFLTYENPDGSHSQLLESLIDLDKTVAEKRQEIAGLISW